MKLEEVRDGLREIKDWSGMNQTVDTIADTVEEILEDSSKSIEKYLQDIEKYHNGDRMIALPVKKIRELIKINPLEENDNDN